MKKYTYNLSMGAVTFVEEKGAIVQIALDEIVEAAEELTPLIAKAYDQFCEYLVGTRQRFDLPLRPKGTAFQQQIWQALQNIPYGETRSYKEIAETIGNPKASRAVGMANNKNPILIVIPCHRVIGANGKLVGYGEGLDLKAQLLTLEGFL